MFRAGIDNFQLKCRLDDKPSRANIFHHELNHFLPVDQSINVAKLANPEPGNIGEALNLETLTLAFFAKLKLLDKVIRLLQPLKDEDDQPKFKPEKFFIEDLIDEVVHASYDQKLYPGIKIAPTKLVAGVDSVYQGYPQALGIALSNLFRNALRSVKETDSKERSYIKSFIEDEKEDYDIEFTVSQSDKDLKITLKDSGNKLADERIPSLFDYGNSDKANDGDVHGYGNGITKDILKSMGASVEYINEPDKAITITMPIQEWVDDGLDFSKRPPYIFLLEDDPSSMNVLKNRCQAWMPKFSYESEDFKACTSIGEMTIAIKEFYSRENLAANSELDAQLKERPLLMMIDRSLPDGHFDNACHAIDRLWQDESLIDYPKPLFTIHSAMPVDGQYFKAMNKIFDNRVISRFDKYEANNGIKESITKYIQLQSS